MNDFCCILIIYLWLLLYTHMSIYIYSKYYVYMDDAINKVLYLYVCMYKQIGFRFPATSNLIEACWMVHIEFLYPDIYVLCSVYIYIYVHGCPNFFLYSCRAKNMKLKIIICLIICGVLAVIIIPIVITLCQGGMLYSTLHVFSCRSIVLLCILCY